MKFKRKNSQGFTLTELLAVIVILAIIALISVPLVSAILHKAKKSTFTRNVENITKTVEIYRYNKYQGKSNEIMTYDISPDGIIQMDDNSDSLQHSGEIGGNGQIVVNEAGDYNIYYTDGEYCAVKRFEDETITIVEGDCSNVDIGGPEVFFSTDSETVVVQKGSSYTLPEATAIAPNGDTVTDIRYVINRIDLDGTKVSNVNLNTNVDIGTKYEVIYYATYEGMTGSKTLNIIVSDLTGPYLSPITNTVSTSKVTFYFDSYDAESGIKKIEYYLYLDDKIIWSKSEDTNVNETMSNKHFKFELEGLSANTAYKIVIKSINETGIETEKSKVFSTYRIDNPTITIEPSGYSQKKKVTIKYPDDNGLKFGYTIGTGNYVTLPEGQNEVTFDVTENVSIVANITDGTNNLKGLTYKINTIDSTKPDILIFQTSSLSSSSIKVRALAEDAESDIYGYQFKIDNGEWLPKEPQADSTYTFTNISAGKHNLSVKAYNTTYQRYGFDEAKGTAEKTLSATIKSCSLPTYTINPANTVWTQAKTVTIDYGSDSDCKGEYSLDNGLTWQTGSKFNIDKNGSIVIARNTDPNGVAVASSVVINYIDTTIPDSVTFTTTKTTKSITITASATDNQSGISKYAFSKDDGATWTAWQTSNQYKFDNLVTNTYKIKVKAYNVAYENTPDNLKTDSRGIKESATSSIQLISCPTPSYSLDPAGNVWSQSKTVTMNYGSTEGCYGSYSIDGGSTWTQTNSVVVSVNNTNVIAKNTDGTNTVTASVQNVNHIDMTQPTLTFSTTKTTKSISIVATATDAESGIGRYSFSNDNGATWTAWQTSNQYTFDNLRTGTYKVKVRVTNKAYENTPANLKNDNKGILVAGPTDVTLIACPTPTYSMNPSGSSIAQVRVVTINYGSTAGCNGSYSIDGGSTWKTGTTQTFTTSGNLVAKNTDGTNTTTASSYSIPVSDTTAPQLSFTTTKTTKSITITATATDAESGIGNYSFSKDNGATWSAWQSGNIYTFDNLPTNTYNIKVRVTNKAYENTPSNLRNDSQGITVTNTTAITLIACPTPTYSVNPSGSTVAQARTVTINYGSTVGCTGSYSLDGGSTWKSGTSTTFVSAGTIVAKNTDGTNTTTASSLTVPAGDTTAPQLSFTTTKTTKSITITANATDSESGIGKYAFSKDNGATWSAWQTENTYTFDNLTTGSYNIRVKVTNKAYENTPSNLKNEAQGITTSAASSITLAACPVPTYSISPAANVCAQSKTVTINYGSTAGCNGSYSVDGGSTWKTGTSATITVNGGNVVAKNTDGTNTSTASAQTVTYIDRTAPSTVSHTVSKTTKSISITASAVDNDCNKKIVAYAFSIDGGKTWSAWQSGNTYTFNNLTTGTYSVTVKAYNATYGTTGANETLGAKSSTPTSVTLDGCGIPTFSVTPSGSVWSQSKSVAINYNSPSGFTGYYSLDGGSTWTAGSSLTTSTNGQAILARATDGVNTCNSSSALTISYTDPSKPTASTHTTTKTTKSITVTASGTDAQSGIKAYSFRINGGSWTAWQTTNSYTFNNLATGTYSIQTKVWNGTFGSTGASETSGVLESSVSNVTLDPCPTPTYSLSAVNGYGWAQYRTVTINYGSTSGCTGSYSTDGGSTWTSGTSVTMNANGNVVAKNTDGTNTVTASSQSVTGIDPSAPTASTHSYTKTTNSITVTASGTDSQSGIKMYSFKIDSGSWTTWQSGNSYTFTGLTTGNHTVQSRVYNGTYGSTGATDAKGALASSASTVTLSGCTAPTMSVSPSGSTWTQCKTVTINGSSGFTTYYSTNGGSTWTAGSSVSVTSNNTTVIAKVSDGTNTCNSSSSQLVNYIDRTAPTASSHSTSRTANSITVTASGTDSESGISRYSFRINSGSWTAWQTSNVYTFTGLSAGTTYTVQSRVYNGTYGNSCASETYGVKESGTSSVATLSNCPTPTFSVSPSGSAWATSRTVTINYGSTSGCTGSYSKNGGSWTSGTSVSFTANGYVTARNVDGAGNAVSSTQNVTNIDSNTPSASLTVTSGGSTISNGGRVSSTVTASLSCSNSGGSGIGSYYIVARDSLYSTVINSTSSSSLSFNPASSTSGSITITAYCTSGAGRQSSTLTQSVTYGSSLTCTPYSSCGSCSSGQAGSKYYDSSCSCINGCYTPTPSTPTYSCTVGASCGSCPSGYTGSKTYNSSCSCVDNCTYSGGSSSGGSSGGSECTSGQTKSVETLGCDERCKKCIHPYTCKNGYWESGWNTCTEYYPSCSGSNPNGTTCTKSNGKKGTKSGCWCNIEGNWTGCTCS